MSQQIIDLDAPEQPSQTQKKGPVICLGMTFEDDKARRTYFTEQLRIKLKDPEFRKIEGFPIGEDEDLLNLSDSPYYTACPNPWIADFIAEWEAEKPAQEDYHREPFAADVKEGKNHPIYNAHSYHTKVPHRAIMRYILHYTNPGDIVFDGFCGTGMTGVAAQLCGDREEVLALGYQIQPDGIILQEETDENGKTLWKSFSKLGVRKAVLNDLSPAATFIAYNYNTPVDVVEFEKEARLILKEVEDEYGWMYETLHTDGKTKGKINFTVWSDVFICSNCGSDFTFWEAAVDMEKKLVCTEFECPSCKTITSKKSVTRKTTTKFNHLINSIETTTVQKPVFINYSIGSKRFEKQVDAFDEDILKKVEESQGELAWAPTEKMMFKGKKWGDTWRAGYHTGVERVNHFYTSRNLFILGKVYSKIENGNYKPRLTNYLLVWFTSGQSRLHKMNRYAPQHSRHVGPMANTYYISSTPAEISPYNFLKSKIANNAFSSRKNLSSLLNNGIATKLSIASDSLDYIFLDPPFGANIMYSELNFLNESWLRSWTNNNCEAIQNSSQNKNIDKYRSLMYRSFSEAYRILKHGHWLTVEFSNTNSGVWNSIQTSLSDAGFIVANVSALNKSRGGLQSIIGSTAVKQDLIISAYKPTSDFETRFEQEAQTEEGVWDFIRTHLSYLPVTKVQANCLQIIPERDPRILYDQVIAFYVRKGFPVPLNSGEFQLGLSQRFEERDGMYFLPEQTAEYDRKKMQSGGMTVTIEMFVKDEASMIDWLRITLKQKPQTFSDLNPQFMRQLGGWSKNEAQLDLRELLNQNFLSYDGTGPVPEQIHAYLSSNWKEMRSLAKDDSKLVVKAKDRWYVPDPNKAGDLEKLREKSLLKEFESYKAEKKKLKIFRLEAVRAGFKKSWQERNYQAIVDIAHKIPNTILEEDPKLLMWYDQATTRLEG
jgi:DNA modification methylase